MTKRSFFYGAMVPVCATTFVAVAGCRSNVAEPPEPNVQAEADRAFRLIDLDNQQVELWPDHQVSATVCLFARTDCPISNRYAPEIVRLYEAFHDLGVEFYLVYVDPDQEAEAIRTHLQEYSYPCRALRDPWHELVQMTGVTVTPEAAVFDAERRLAYRGRIDDLYVDFGKSRPRPTQHDLADAIQAVLEGTAIAEPFTKAVGCYISDLNDK